MMDKSPENILLKTMHEATEPFTVKSLRDSLSKAGHTFSVKAVTEAVRADPYLIELDGDRFISHAGAFSGKLFCATLTAEEISQGVFVAGDRCMPFGNAELPSDSFKFFAGGEEVPKKTGTFDSDTAIDMFMLYGEEYTTQYIALDPANADMDLTATDYAIPNTVKLTGFDLSFIAEKCGCKDVDRLYFRMTDWKNGVFEVYAKERFRGNPFGNDDINLRLKWFNLLEKKCLEHFEHDGPMTSIEEQLVYIFCGNTDALCVPHCGSLEEFLFSYSKKVGFQKYGTETRLWRKGESVPFFGKWNKTLVDFNETLKSIIRYENYVLSVIPVRVYEQLAENYSYLQAYGDKDFEDYIADFLKAELCFVSAEQVKKISKGIRARFYYVFNEYNRFCDNELGRIRKSAVELFVRVSSLLYRINYSGNVALSLPPQELIILHQLYSHTVAFLEEFSEGYGIDADSLDALSLSLDGMILTFDTIDYALESALENEMRQRFKVVKNRGSAKKRPGKSKQDGK